MYPMFSEEYATKTWWHEQYHGNQALVNLEAWRSAGIEVYRNFDFEDFSLPVYFYPWLNGEDTNNTWPSPTPYKYTDNNSYKNLLLHVAPNSLRMGQELNCWVPSVGEYGIRMGTIIRGSMPSDLT